MNKNRSQAEVSITETPKVQQTIPEARATTQFETGKETKTNEEPQKSSRVEERKEQKLKKSLETQLQLQPLKIDASEFEGFAKGYCDKLTPQMRDSFYDVPTLFKKMEEGYERHYLKIIAYHDGKKMAHGLACVNVD